MGGGGGKEGDSREKGGLTERRVKTKEGVGEERERMGDMVWPIIWSGVWSEAPWQGRPREAMLGAREAMLGAREAMLGAKETQARPPLLPREPGFPGCQPTLWCGAWPAACPT